MRRYWFPKHRARLAYPLACRVFGHSWERTGRLQLQCRRCPLVLHTGYKGRRR